MQKEDKRTFLWGTTFSVTLTLFACIFLFCYNVMPRTAFAATAGSFLLASGLVCAVAFFVGQPMHAARMLAGVVQVSVGIWALATCTHFSGSILALGLGVFLVFVAASEVFAGVNARGRRWEQALRFLLAAGYLTIGVLLFTNNFAQIFPNVRSALIAAGVTIAVFCIEELCFLIACKFVDVETLVYRRAERQDDLPRK